MSARCVLGSADGGEDRITWLLAPSCVAPTPAVVTAPWIAPSAAPGPPGAVSRSAATMASVTFPVAVVGALRGLGVATPGTPPSVPTGALYTILLMLHILCAVVGFGTMVVTGVEAARARRGPSVPGADGVRRYFRPGVNWAGRALYGVPVFGFSLIEASDGAFRSGDSFVVVGLAVWLVAALLAEVVVWPGERRIQVELTERWGGDTDGSLSRSLDRDCRQVAAAAAVLAVLFVAATVIMVGKP